MIDVELFPWFSPMLSPAIIRVIQNLGHRSFLEKGEEISSGFLSNRIIFVQNGYVSRAILSPANHTPFQLMLSGPGSFGPTGGCIHSYDSCPRRYWAATRCELLSVRPEILLPITEANKRWYDELMSYGLRQHVCEKLGMMICRVANADRRFGVFLVSFILSSMKMTKLLKSNLDWIELRSLPSRSLIPNIIACSPVMLDGILREWIDKKYFQHENGVLKVKRMVLLEHWRWLKPFLLMRAEIEQSLLDSITHETIKEADVFPEG